MFEFPIKVFWIIENIFRTIFAVYEMVGTPADMTKAEERFLKLDQNSDGYISQEEFISIIKRDHNLLNILQKTTWISQQISTSIFWDSINYQ